MSMGFYGVNGIYNSHDLWADHIALQHRVHLVVAAGNYNKDMNKFDNYVLNPALAYNVITVGNLNDMNTPTLTDDSIYWKSCYQEDVDSNSKKPDIVAPGTNIATPYEPMGTGTSFAAPFVTGILVQLCQANPSLKINPAMAKAILCASAAAEPHSYYTTHPNYDRYGAGLVNAQRAYASLTNGYYVNDHFSAETVGGTINQYTFTIDSTKSKVKLALTWLNHKLINNSQDHSSAEDEDIIGATTMPNLDINIFDSNNNIVTGSAVSKGNVEVIDICDLPAGTYTIKVIASTGSNKTIYYSLAWWY